LKEELAAERSKRTEPFSGFQESVQLSFPMRNSADKIAITDTLGNIFLIIANSIIAGTTSERSISMNVRHVLIQTHRVSASNLGMVEELPGIKARLFRLSLIHFERDFNQRASRTEQHWVLTEYGRQQYNILAS